MQAPSKKIITMIVSAIIVVGAVGANKFWPSTGETPLITPTFDTPKIAGGKGPQGNINATAFLQSIATSSAATTTDNTPASPSRDVARSLFANTTYMENSNALDDTSKAALVQNAINQLQSSFAFKQYDATGLKYISNENQLTVKKYASDFATLQIGMILVMQTNVSKIESDLSVLAGIYAEQAKALYELKVPKDLAETHLEIVNNFSKSAAAFYAFQNHKSDPLVVPLAMRSYQEAAAEQDLLLKQVAQFIASNGIIFASDEAGGYWNAFQ